MEGVMAQDIPVFPLRITAGNNVVAIALVRIVGFANRGWLHQVQTAEFPTFFAHPREHLVRRRIWYMRIGNTERLSILRSILREMKYSIYIIKQLLRLWLRAQQFF